MKPLFAVGETVLHKVKNKVGKVESVFDTESGPRYYVRHSGWTWSIPESGLDSKIVISRTQQNQELSGTENLQMPTIGIAALTPSVGTKQ